MRLILIFAVALVAWLPTPRADAAVLRGPGYAAAVTMPTELPNGRRWFFAIIEPKDWRVWRRDVAPWRRAFVLVLPERVKRRYPVVVLMRFNRNAPEPEPEPVEPPPAVTPLPAPLGFLLAGLGVFAWLRRRQSASATP